MRELLASKSTSERLELIVESLMIVGIVVSGKFGKELTEATARINFEWFRQFENKLQYNSLVTEISTVEKCTCFIKFKIIYQKVESKHH